MFEEKTIISQSQIINTPEMSKPVVRTRYGTVTKHLTEHKVFGFIKYWRLSHEETVWHDEYFDYDIQTGEAICVTKIKAKRPRLHKQVTVVTGEDK